MRRGKWGTGVIVAAAALAASMVWTGAPAGAATGPVSATPASGTPQLAKLTNTGTFQQVRQLAQCGSTMYAVGTFNTITWNGTTYTRNNVFSFSATKPYTVTSWDPNADGTVNGITFSPDCSTAYLGGKFSTVGGGSAKNIAAVSTSTGALISTFA